MSSLIEFIAYIRYRDAGQIDRVASYFDSATRPDFPEDVSESEADWVDAFDTVSYPDSIERPDTKTLVLYFSGDDLDDLADELSSAIALTNPQLVLSYSDIEDHALYERWHSGRSEIVWDPQQAYPDADKMLWSEEQIATFRACSDKPLKILSAVASALRTPLTKHGPTS